MSEINADSIRKQVYVHNLEETLKQLIADKEALQTRVATLTKDVQKQRLKIDELVSIVSDK